ncbi:protein ZNF365 [Ambystoma mexicanum]|uniref:protein ZNF365 n=1 Tax=Ambystoma mexicanum TaxID=8296 RepID=UPI0037E79FED
MQQKSLEGKKAARQEMFENSAEYKPFRCPQCGDHARFRNLSCLSAHLDYNHRFENRNHSERVPLFSSLKANDKVPCSEALVQQTIANINNANTYSSVQLFEQSSENLKNKRLLDIATKNHSHFLLHRQSGVSLTSQNSMTQFQTNGTRTTDSHGKGIVDSAEKTEKRIDKLAKELSRKTAELLDIQSAFLQLSQRKQEVQQRERALNRQVDVAVELIAGLKQRLTESEHELLKKEEEVLAINNFLETAAEKEIQGKVKLCQFIENLLQRVDLAEKQLEYYQIQKNILRRNHNVKEHMPTDAITRRKPNHQSHGHHSATDGKPHLIQNGRMLMKKGLEDSTVQNKFYYKPTDCSRDSCKLKKKGDSLLSGQKSNNKCKVGKKAN